MTTPLDLEIRRRVAAVLEGKSSLRDFYRWFAPTTWEVDPKDLEAIRLRNEITHLFNIRSAGELTPGEFKLLLDFAVSTYIATATPWHQPVKPNITLTTSSENDITENLPIRFVVRRRPVAVSA